MANQYVAFREADRPYAEAHGEVGDWMFLPITGSLQPKFTAKDDPRKEFKGADTALGDSTVIRRESQWTWTLECAWYPGVETAMLIKHALGKAGARTVVDTTAHRGILYPVAMPYGLGRPLEYKSLDFAINTDEEGVTKSQMYMGGRIKSLTITMKGLDDIKLAFEISGAGEWVSVPDMPAVSGVTWPESSTPFQTSDILCYIGGTPTRTGVAPDYTNIDKGSAVSFRPDELTIKIVNGLEDVVKLNGTKGASVTRRQKQFTTSVDFTVDYSDPTSGEFSSADEFKRRFYGVATNNLLLVLDNKELAGSATENYKAVIDLPYMVGNTEGPERGTEGKTPTIKYTYSSLLSATCKYPVAVLTTDKEATYGL